MSIAYAAATAAPTEAPSATTPNWSVGIPIIIIFVVIPALLIFLKKHRKKKKQKEASILAETYDKRKEALGKKVISDGFYISGSKWCADLCVMKKPQKKFAVTKGFLIDDKNRKVAFAWLEEPLRIKYIDYDDIISCEILYDGVTKTNTTHMVTGSNGVYAGNSFSTSTDYVNSLGIKVMLRDPSNPKFVMPLITQRVKEENIAAVACERFAQEVKDSIYAIINA